MFEYDVFLSHSSRDKAEVEKVARKLRDHSGLRVFFDRWVLVPGTHWQDALQQALAGSRTCAVFLGPEKLAPWHNEEMRIALGQRVAEEPKRVIPVLLPGAREDAVPDFLAQRTWVDLRNGVEEEGALDPLIAGIRGTMPQDSGRGVPEEQGPTPRRPKSRAPRQARISSVQLGLAIGALGVLLTTLAWLYPRDTDPPSSPPDLYALRLQILDPDARPVDGATVRISSGNEPHLLPDGWWQIEIPRAKLPLDGKLTLWAEHPRWNSARRVLQLGGDPNPQLEIRLEVPKERISGVVASASNQAIAGARVSVRDHRGSSATTDQDGHFELWVTAARNQKARLHVEHSGYPPQDGSCYVGRDGCSLILEAE